MSVRYGGPFANTTTTELTIIPDCQRCKLLNQLNSVNDSGLLDEDVVQITAGLLRRLRKLLGVGRQCTR